MTAPHPRTDVTGLVLAGGRASRMGGIDKGLQPYHGIALAQHALQRLAPQVGHTMMNANRHLDAYSAMNVPVWPDALPDYPGPLAGFLAGLSHCETPYLVTVPCDSPLFPLDLVERLYTALEAARAEIAMPVTREHGDRRLQPVFSLMRTSVRQNLEAFMQSGQRKVEVWAAQLRHVEVEFADADAFANANTLGELQQLASGR